MKGEFIVGEKKRKRDMVEERSNNEEPSTNDNIEGFPGVKAKVKKLVKVAPHPSSNPSQRFVKEMVEAMKERKMKEDFLKLKIDEEEECVRAFKRLKLCESKEGKEKVEKKVKAVKGKEEKKR